MQNHMNGIKIIKHNLNAKMLFSPKNLILPPVTLFQCSNKKVFAEIMYAAFMGTNFPIMMIGKRMTLSNIAADGMSTNGSGIFIDMSAYVPDQIDSFL